MNNNHHLFMLVLIMVVIFCVYAKVLNFGFVWLDHFQIEGEECIIKNFLQVKSLFFNPLLSSRGKGNYYRPLFKVSYTCDYLLYGLNPRGFHFTNLILHTLNVFLLYIILIYLGIDRVSSLLSSILYAVLPLNVSTVVWLGARADLLCAFFVLFSFLMFLKFEERNKNFWYWLSLLGYILAVMSKEITIGFLFVIAVWIYVRRKSFKLILPYLLISGGYLLWRFLVLGKIGTRRQLLWGTPYSTILSSLVGFLKYIFKFFFPYNLSVSDAFPKYNSIFHPLVCVSLTFTVLVVIFFLKYLFSKRQILALAIGWIFCFFVPISNIVPALHFWAERFFYLPGIGMAMFVAYIIDSNVRVRRMFYFLFPMYLIINLNYQKYFNNDFLLFQRAIRISKFSREAHTMLGYLYMQKGNYPRAVYHYTFALQDIPWYYTYVYKPAIFNNLGVIFMRLGDYSRARFYFQEGLKISPDNKYLLANLKILANLEKEK